MYIHCTRNYANTKTYDLHVLRKKQASPTKLSRSFVYNESYEDKEDCYGAVCRPIMRTYIADPCW